MTDPAAFARLLEPGDPAPWFRTAVLGGDPRLAFDKLGGRHVLLLLFGSAAHPAVAEALRMVGAEEGLFDDARAAFFGVSIDPADISQGRIGESAGRHFFLDGDRAVSTLFGASGGDPAAYRPHWLLIDPALRVAARFALGEGARALAAVAAASARPSPEIAPILQVPHILEPALCRQLVDHYEREGGAESGVMRQEGGRTILVIDHRHKRRSDCEIADEQLREAIRRRIVRRLAPMIRRAFQFEVTRIERYIVACYDSASGGHFNPHRDNTTMGTAHRRFAVTINLNEEYDGGDLRFPEWGSRAYRAPPGGAVVFSCSMLHEATPVTAGRRYATLPFLYDEAAAAVRQANRHALAEPGQTDGAPGPE